MSEKKFTVLVVEDDPSMRGFLEQYFTQKGCRVLLETDGFSALTRIGQLIDCPDLILTDVSLPGMGGVELLQQVRQIHPRLPVIFLTGLSEQGLYQPEGPTPDAVLQKPVRLSELHDVIHRVIGLEEVNQKDAPGQGSDG